MSLNIEFVQLNLSTLAMSMGKTQEEADTLLQTFAKEQGITLTDTFFFEFLVTQGTKRNITYLSYGAVPDGTKGSSGIQISQLKHQNFFKFSCSEETFRSSLENELGEKIQAALKDHGYTLDMSKIYGLMQKEESNIIFYFQYK